MLPSLEEFLVDMEKRPWNSYVRFPGFTDLYVRKGPVFIDGEKIDKTLTVANVSASIPGKGAFSSLIKKALEWGLNVYVENAHSPDLLPKLEHLGFKKCNQHLGPNYFLDNETHQSS